MVSNNSQPNLNQLVASVGEAFRNDEAGIFDLSSTAWMTASMIVDDRPKTMTLLSEIVDDNGPSLLPPPPFGEDRAEPEPVTPRDMVGKLLWHVIYDRLASDPDLSAIEQARLEAKVREELDEQ